jgi:hypothetical protein
MLWDRLGRPYQAALPLLDTTEAAHLRESLTRLVDLGADASSSTGTPCHARSLYLLQPRWPRTTTKAHRHGLTAHRKFFSSFSTAIPMRRSPPVCSFQSGLSGTICRQSSASWEATLVRAPPRRLKDLGHAQSDLLAVALGPAAGEVATTCTEDLARQHGSSIACQISSNLPSLGQLPTSP